MTETETNLDKCTLTEQLYVDQYATDKIHSSVCFFWINTLQDTLPKYIDSKIVGNFHFGMAFNVKPFAWGQVTSLDFDCALVQPHFQLGQNNRNLKKSTHTYHAVAMPLQLQKNDEIIKKTYRNVIAHCAKLVSYNNNSNDSNSNSNSSNSSNSNSNSDSIYEKESEWQNKENNNNNDQHQHRDLPIQISLQTPTGVDELSHATSFFRELFLYYKTDLNPKEFLVCVPPKSIKTYAAIARHIKNTLTNAQ